MQQDQQASVVTREQPLLGFGQSLQDGGEPVFRFRLPARNHAGVVGIKVLQRDLLSRADEISSRLNDVRFRLERQALRGF